MGDGGPKLSNPFKDPLGFVKDAAEIYYGAVNPTGGAGILGAKAADEQFIEGPRRARRALNEQLEDASRNQTRLLDNIEQQQAEAAEREAAELSLEDRNNARRRQRLRALSARGRSSRILTSPLGEVSDTPLARKEILGS